MTYARLPLLLFVMMIPLTSAAGEAGAHWIDRSTLLWDPPAGRHTVSLVSAGPAPHGTRPEGLTGVSELALSACESGLSAAQRERFPHLAELACFRVPARGEAALREFLTGQILAVARDHGVTSTGVQLPGVLDDLYAWDGPLGATFAADGSPTLRVWAPTARSVRLLRFADSRAPEPLAVTAMDRVPGEGVWELAGEPGWHGQYYLYETTVFAPSTGRIETNRVTDPYALSLAPDSARSQLVDLAHPETRPEGWAGRPRLSGIEPEDGVFYELHVRDFSIADRTVPAPLRGTYLAFTVSESDGMVHLRRLADAGVSHLHLLPVFDIATVPESSQDQAQPDADVLAALAPDSDRQQAVIAGSKARDGFNWGYDPWHYTVPEGSYATEPDGMARIREFRAMVAALNGAGLRVVMDVVYNHTHAAGQDARSVLDRIVPGYYQRLEADGSVATSTCCANTASEHRMMEKLMVDSVLTWARHYRIDGFRFDLMGHHSKANMTRLRAALDALTPEVDGVDGRSIYLYGEGWNFGEVANDARFIQARQGQLAGTGIGTFSDRLRDAARGGFHDSDVRTQGYLNGLCLQPNAWERSNGDDDCERLLRTTDWIRLGLAGDLASYPLLTAAGTRRLGSEIDYNGSPAGYTADPQENISYVAAHDNETLFDANQLKLPRAVAMADRVRVQALGSALVLLGQGVPFVHAGQEFLRSKSLDRDSYDSGDWFNAIDWTQETGNWGRGLPIADRNEEAWPLMRPLLGDPTLASTPADRRRATEQFLSLLEIRMSTPLFRLRTAKDVLDKVRFHNTGPDQLPGLIAMSIEDTREASGGPFAAVLVLFNARPEPVTFPIEALAASAWVPHPKQAEENLRAGEGGFVAQARSASVYVLPR